MAYHDSAVTLNGGGSSALLGNMPATSTGDYLCAVVTQDSNPPPTYTPSDPGWTQIDQGLVTADGQTMTYFEFTGGTPSSPPASYTFSSSDGGDAQVLIASFSGRSLSRTFLTQTINNTVNNSPVSASVTGGTSAGDDDLFVVIALDKTDSAALWSFATPTGSPGTFILRQNADTNTEFVGIGMGTIDNIGAGPTGSISDTITRTGATDGIGYLGWVVSLAVGGPTVTVQPTQQTAFVGQTATFSITAIGSGTVHYQWIKNGSNVGSDSSTYAFTVGFVDVLALISCTVTDNNGSVPSIQVYMIVIGAVSVGWLT